MIIIFADDEPSTCAATIDALIKRGHLVVPVLNGLDAIAEFNRNANIDLVITDMRMGDGPTGLDVVRHVSNSLRGTKTCLISGLLDDRIIREAENFGAVTMDKPYLFSALCKKLCL
jgi:CheY-like chemotaxis protein